jgi:serpin B
MKYYLIPAFLLLICTTVYSWHCPILKDDITNSKLSQGQQKFTINFLQHSLKRNPHGSIFFSPYSIYRTLLLAYSGSDGLTETSLKNDLYLDWSHDKNEVLNAYKHDKSHYLQYSKAEPLIAFESVDKFFIDKHVAIRDCMKKLFSDEIEQLDIHNQPEAARKYINKWVEKITKDHIKELLPKGSVDEITNLAIANAAYFQGDWLKKFETSSTKKEKFYKTPSEHIMVDMMKQTNQFNFNQDNKLNSYVLELPYNKSSPTGSNISFIVVLPKEDTEKALETVLNKFTPETFADTFPRLSDAKVSVSLPKFTFEQNTQLLPILSDMGLGHMFKDDADFSGFSETTKIFFNEAYHKAKIEVDEYGTTGVAGTAVLQYESPPLPFIAERPFFYMVHDLKTNMILFAGVYRGPE